MPDTTSIPTDFSVLVHEYERPLYLFLSKMPGDPDVARELLQDTFSDAWQAYRRSSAPFIRGSTPSEVRRWLYHVAYHQAIDTLRRRRLIRWESLERNPASDVFALPDPRSFEEALAERDLLSTALAQLSPEDVASLVLTIVQGFTAAEAAGIMKSSSQAIAKRISRARRKLVAAYLKEYARMREDERS
jgi:RNA polymerase sigma-70 factor (ECF subfamily)